MSTMTVMRTLLLSSSEVSTAAGGRIYAGELPAAQAASMPRRAIVVTPSGGVGLGSRDYSDLVEPRVDIKCYGATSVEAEDVHKVVRKFLRQLRPTVAAGILVHRVVVESHGSYLRDGPAEWPMYLSVYDVAMGEE